MFKKLAKSMGWFLPNGKFDVVEIKVDVIVISIIILILIAIGFSVKGSC